MGIMAEKEAALSAIRMQQQINEQESKKNMAIIADEQYLHQQKAQADAHFYRITREAEANAAMLTPEFLYLEMLRAVGDNTKIYFGQSINALFLSELIEGNASPGVAG